MRSFRDGFVHIDEKPVDALNDLADFFAREVGIALEEKESTVVITLDEAREVTRRLLHAIGKLDQSSS